MTEEMFFDTNILCYAYDLNEPQKRKICKELVEDVFSGKTKGIISNQILVELYNALTRKSGVDLRLAGTIVSSLISSKNWIKVNYDHRTVKSAIVTSKIFKSPFLDTLIAETMRSNYLRVIVTENESDFKKIPGITVLNVLSK
jgi:predicted nucleic acid-binding protein